MTTWGTMHRGDTTSSEVFLFEGLADIIYVMIPSENVNAILTLHNKLLGIDWRLIGSSNLALQGVDIEAKDVDISIKVEAIQAVQKALQEYCIKQIEYTHNNGYSSYFGHFTIEGVQVDVMAGSVQKDGVKTSEDSQNVKPVFVKVDGIFIPCVDLNTEYDAYISMGRKEKAALIKKVIDKGK